MPDAAPSAAPTPCVRFAPAGLIPQKSDTVLGRELCLACIRQAEESLQPLAGITRLTTTRQESQL